MRVLLVLCLLPALLFSGCRKKSSPEFFKLEADQSILAAREGDEAWSSPEMNEILVKLQAIPEEAIEKPRAVALVEKITSEQARVASTRVKIPKSAPPTKAFDDRPSEPTPPPAEVGPPPAGADQADGGGPTQPWPGMDEKNFVARFGSCFGAPAKAILPDGRPATSYAVAAGADCQKQFGPGVSFLFTEKGLWGKATETSQILDAGLIYPPPAPPPPPPPPAPPPVNVMPGGPQPEGYDKAPAPAQPQQPQGY